MSVVKILESNVEKILDYLRSQGKLKDAYDVYLPLVSQIITWKQEIDRPLIQGIVGGQGTGKTTLCRLLKRILEIAGYPTVSLSLDDLYKTYGERQELQLKEPKLLWRGPPGTHDVELGIRTLEQIRQGDRQQVITLPQFDKSLWEGMGDRTTPELVNIPDIILFEGWFVGVLPRVESDFSQAPTPIASEDTRAFAVYINQKLYEYLPLWEKLDKLILLYPEDYRFCLQWRLQAESEMIAFSQSGDKIGGQNDGKKGMTLTEVTSFVEYFWQALPPELFMFPLTRQPTPVNLVIPINSDHSFGQFYFP